jgi:type II secretory pathway pseudopilin PulG
MTSLLVSLLVFAALAAGVLFASARALPAAEEEESLNSGQAACQASQAYWRELGQARDWESLKAQVRRWQERTAPGWSESEVEQVARNLNQAVFRFAVPGARGMAGGQQQLTMSDRPQQP